MSSCRDQQHETRRRKDSQRSQMFDASNHMLQSMQGIERSDFTFISRVGGWGCWAPNCSSICKQHETNAGLNSSLTMQLVRYMRLECIYLTRGGFPTDIPTAMACLFTLHHPGICTRALMPLGSRSVVDNAGKHSTGGGGGTGLGYRRPSPGALWGWAGRTWRAWRSPLRG